VRADDKTIEGRKRLVSILEELRIAGLLRYQLSTQDLTGPEPHLDIFAEKGAVARQAPADLSDHARRVWEWLRTGKVQSAVAFFDAVRKGAVS